MADSQCSLSEAEEYFRGRRLGATLTLGDGEPDLPGMDGPPQIKTSFDVKSFTAKPGYLSASLVFVKAEVENDHVLSFAGREAVLELHEVAAIPNEESGDDPPLEG
jgi:hypothetical protein